MQVFIRGPGNSTILVDVGPNETVLMLKRLVWARLRVPVEAMWMESGGRILHDQLRLWESGIRAETTVWCHVRAGGRACALCMENRRGA